MWPAILRAEQTKYKSHSNANAFNAELVLLPRQTRCARRSITRKSLNDNREEAKDVFGWFTYVLEDDDVEDETTYFEKQLSNYDMQYDEDGNKTTRPTFLFTYELQEDVRFYNMSSPDTIRFLQNNLKYSENIDAVFSIHNEIVYRNSDPENDRNLFIQLIREKFIDDEMIQGWLHDDMPHVTLGIHRREAVILNPAHYLLQHAQSNMWGTPP